MIDNASSDDTSAIARSSPHTTVWQTDAGYAEAAFGQLWIGAVARRHGLGKWVLNVDVDEHLVYDGMDRHELGVLCSWLRSRGKTRLFAPLIDLYPRLPPPLHERLWRTLRDRLRGGSAGSNSESDDNCYFDRSGPSRSPNYHFCRAGVGMYVKGGVRARVIGGSEDVFWLNKVPLALWDRDTAYCNVHFPFPFHLNPCEPYAALLHYKFVGDFRRRVSTAVSENQHWRDSYEYKLYEQWLGTRTPLFDRHFSVRYRSPKSLVSQGLLMPIDWDERLQNP